MKSTPSVTLSSALIFSTHIQDAIAVNLKGDFNLWLSTRSWRNSTKLKFAQQVVVLQTFTKCKWQGKAYANVISDTRVTRVTRVTTVYQYILVWVNSI